MRHAFYRVNDNDEISDNFDIHSLDLYKHRLRHWNGIVYIY